MSIDRSDAGGRSHRCNVLMIMADQFRYDALSCLGNPVVQTPNLDRLAAQGVHFTSATCSHPVCGPSRASLLTGMYAHGHRMMHNAGLDADGLDEAVDTLDEILHRNGYRTAYFGKWHTGRANRSCYDTGCMYGHRIDRYRTYLAARYPVAQQPGQKVDRYTGWGYDPVPLDEMMLAAKRNGYHMPHHHEAGRLDVAPDDTLTAWTARGVIDYLDRTAEEPFALTCSFLHPHAPLVAADPYFARYDPAGMPMPANVADDCRVKAPNVVPDAIPLDPAGLGQFIALYYGLISEIDDWIGKILAALERNGLSERTLVIFLSDHGELMGSHGTLSKNLMFEESVRVPVIMRLPHLLQRGRRVETPFTGADLLPTILDLTGLPIPADVHGRSARQSLINGGRTDHKRYAYCELYDKKAIRSTRWKFVLNPRRQTNLDERCQLYDLAHDPGEQTNLLAPANQDRSSKEIGRRLKLDLIHEMETIGVPGEQLDRYHHFEW